MAFNRFDRQNNLGGLLGDGLDLGGGINSLLQQNLSEMLNQKQDMQTSRGLQALGFNPQEANAMSGVDLDVLNALQHQNPMGATMRQEQQRHPKPVQPSYREAEEIKEEQEIQPAKKPRGKKGAKLSPEESERLTKLTTETEKKLTAKEKKERERLQAAKDKVDLAEKHYINKETKPLYDEINKEYKSATNNDKRLDRIEKLTKEGNLGIPLYNSTIKALSKGIFGFGIDLTGTLTTDAQELDKLSTDFIREAKSIFPGRVTDSDLNQFLKIIPTLSQSNRGRLRVIHNMKLFNEGAKVRKKSMDQIIKENGGYRPYNLSELIEERSKDQLDKIADDFEKSRPDDKAHSLAEAASRLGEGLLYY